MSETRLLSRREFLRCATAAGGTMLFTACAPSATPSPSVATEAPAQEQPTEVPPTATVAAEAEKPTIEFLGFAAYEDDVHQDAFAAFSDAYPDITLELSTAPSGDWNEYLAKVNSRLAAGDPPDLVGVPTYGQFIAWGRKGLLLSLDEFMESDPEFDADDLPPKVLNDYRVGGKLYGMPKGYVTHAVFYNKALFDEAGVDVPTADWTWDDLLDKAKALTGGEGSDKVFGFYTFTFAPGHEHWWWTNGGPGLFDRRGPREFTDPTADDPKNIEAVQWLADLRLVHGVAPTSEQLGVEDATSRQLTGRMAMWHGTTIDTVNLLQNTDKVDWYVVPTPGGYEGAPTASMMWQSGFGIVAKSPYPEACWEFLKFNSVGEGTVIMARTGFQVPSGFSQVGAFLTDELKARGGQVFVDASDYDVVSSDSLGEHHVQLSNTAVTPNNDAIFLGEKTADEGMRDMQVLMEDVLAQRAEEE